MITPNKIRELCDNWCNSVRQPDGGIAIGGQSEQYRLLRNGIRFHELNFDQLVAAIDGLTKVLLLPGLNTIVDQDHFGLWSWCSEIILSREADFFADEEHELRKLFETCIRSSLVHCKKPATTKEEWQHQVKIDQQVPHNARYFLQESSLTLAYLAFPLLEAISKKTCNSYVDMNGGVITRFVVPSKSGGEKEYDPIGRRKQCSSLRDLLFLIYLNVANDELKNALSEFRNHIATVENSGDPFDVIYKWRNQSLHGSTSFQTIGGTLLNLALLIAIYQLSDRYDSLKIKTLERCRWEMQNEHRSPWAFYPPY